MYSRSRMLDLAIRGGELVDGTGAPRRRADVGIQEGRVVAIGDVDWAREDIDATGLIVSPGFIAHSDAEGAPVPSRSATSDELVAVAGVCRQFEGTSLEFIPNGIHPFSDEELEFLSAMSRAAGRPLNWNVLRIAADNRDH